MPIKTVTVDAQSVATHPHLTHSQWANNVQITADGGAQISYDPTKVGTNDDGFAFVYSQLESIEKRFYDKPYAQITYLDDVPIAGGVLETDTEWSWVVYDERLMARFASSSAADMPTVASEGVKTKSQIHQMTVEASWGVRELAITAINGRSIDAGSYRRADRAIKELTQRSVYFGNEEMNMKGLFNNPNVTLLPVEDSANLENMTGMDLYHLINSALFEIDNASVGAHRPTRVLLAPAVAKVLTEQLIPGAIPATNAMKYLQENNYIKLTYGTNVEFVPRFQLRPDELQKNGIGDGSTTRIVIYSKDEENLCFANPKPFGTLPPQARGHNIHVPCEGLTSGTEFIFPLSATYIDVKVAA